MHWHIDIFLRNDIFVNFLNFISRDINPFLFSCNIELIIVRQSCLI